MRHGTACRYAAREQATAGGGGGAPGTAAFSAVSLAELCELAGFGVREEECAATVAGAAAGAGAGGGGRRGGAVSIREDEFVDHVSRVTRGMASADIVQCVRVFYLVDGLRKEIR